MKAAFITGLLGSFFVTITVVGVCFLIALSNGGDREAFYYAMFWMAPPAIGGGVAAGFFVFFTLALCDVYLRLGNKMRFAFYLFLLPILFLLVTTLLFPEIDIEKSIRGTLIVAFPCFLVALVRTKIR